VALRVKINPEKAPDRDVPMSIGKLSVISAEREILRDVSFELAAGEILGIIGENEAGKSTIVSAIAGLVNNDVQLDYHHALHNGEDFFDLSITQRYEKGIHCVLERRQLFPGLSVKENLLVAMTGASNSEQTARLNDVCDLFSGLDNLLKVKARKCNAAQQQIVAIARAVMAFPSILILDEPTSGLELQEIEAIVTVLQILASSSMSIIVLDRRKSFIQSCAHRTLWLQDGKLSEPIAEVTRAMEWKPQ
jgi:branched-chain amino acid transport system ATP-binding protein